MSKHNTCILCGTKLRDQATFCTRCGEPTDRVKYSQAPDGSSLADKDVITVGRSEDNVLPLDRPYISRRHATLRRVAGGWEVTDHKTMSGTYINGEPIWGTRLAVPGDTIGVGSSDIHIEDDGTPVQRKLEGKLFLEGWGLTYRVRNPRREIVSILDNASIVVWPEELLAFSGPAATARPLCSTLSFATCESTRRTAPRANRYAPLTASR